MAVDRKLGFLLLSIYLIATGANAFLRLSFNGENYVMGGLALAAGIVLLIRR